MRVSTSTARDVFANLHWTCPHCGAELKRATVNLFGKDYVVPCYASCGCEESKWDGLDVPRGHRGYAKAGIPERYIKPDDEPTGFASDVARGLSLYVHGPNGTAKSTLAGKLATELVDMGVSVRWENSRHMMSEIQGMYGGRGSDVLERAYACRALVLDDIGKEQPTAHAISMLYELVEQRYGAMKPIVVTSNFDRAELAARWSQADAETAEAIVSRLCDGCQVIEMGGPDRRLG